ncbi:MAG: hypothetical protein DI599_15985 [Pseudomonas kuykendallii]|uniref:Uncharacterized protein n=1 Tax=Pseudomonas kuykendallii TaxID=1007099 RepID=A0A2W5EQE6_9PSED|nr:MAG: hypothetical protein DI599_15985 [Pseudomonas kuykendallii]
MQRQRRAAEAAAGPRRRGVQPVPGRCPRALREPDQRCAERQRRGAGTARRRLIRTQECCPCSAI